VPTSLFDLTGRVAIVTGAARGLGRVLAQGLAAHGARVKEHTVRIVPRAFTVALLVATGTTSVASAQIARWPEQKANAWYARQPWLVGSNYLPAYAIN
jgi:hypothetical protein